MPEYNNPEHELVQRTRRIETRLMKLCNFLGLDPARARDRVIVHGGSVISTLDVAGMDVSLGNLFDTCRKNGITHSVGITHKGVLLATITVTKGVVYEDMENQGEEHGV